jgi:large subunit ribosomal protein L15
MNLSNLQPAEGATHNQNKRLGRGEGSGKGGTSARGHKGAKSRSGYSKKVGFEGGQMPLQRRVPKFGFNNINRKDYQVVNLDKLQALVDSAKITDSANLDTFVANGISATTDLVKVTGRGELKAKLTITAHKFTASAKQAIIAAGGEAIEL